MAAYAAPTFTWFGSDEDKRRAIEAMTFTGDGFKAEYRCTPPTYTPATLDELEKLTGGPSEQTLTLRSEYAEAQAAKRRALTLKLAEVIQSHLSQAERYEKRVKELQDELAALDAT